MPKTQHEIETRACELTGKGMSRGHAQHLANKEAGVKGDPDLDKARDAEIGSSYLDKKANETMARMSDRQSKSRAEHRRK